MKILFVSTLYPLALKNELALNCKRNTFLQNQADAFQWAMLEGLVLNESDFKVIAFPGLGTYPLHFKRLFVPESKIVYNGRCYGTSLRYSTLMVYKDLDIQMRLKKYVEKWISQVASITTDEPLLVLVYTSAVMFVKPLTQLKRKYHNLHICCVITDLIDDAMNFDFNKSFLKRIQIAREQRLQKKLYKKINFFILLSKAMEEKIPESVGKNIVIEGIYGKHELSDVKNICKADNLKIILYGGTLEEFSGVNDLVDAFMLLNNQNYRLIICGSGFCEAHIKECAQKDGRIIYKGMISREDFLLLQRKATLLVNPRKPTGAITRFSFPSKTIEYLASGTPMLGYKLEGIPTEYYNYFYTVDDCSLQMLVDKLENVLSLSNEERHLMAEKARNFIYQNKTAKYQIGKILRVLESRLGDISG